VRVIVVGAGVIGLSCAARLLADGHRVDVVARDLPRETTSAVAAALWYPYLALPLDRVLGWSHTSYDAFARLACLRKCSTCGLLFNSPRLDDHELAQLYGKNYYFFNRSDATELARIPAMYARSVALVAHEFNHDDRRHSLDIGSGRGYFPAVLKQLGWDAHGVEISREAAEYARSRFGLDTIYTGTIEQFADENQTPFPLVTAVDVIEHVPSPASFAHALGQLVSSGGLAIIDTPNAAAYNIGVEGVGWRGFNPFHIYLFTISNLRQLLEANGFKVEQSFSYNNTPADRDRKPLKDRLLRQAVDAARSTGVIGPIARAYFKLKSMKRQPIDVEPQLAAAMKQIQSAPPFNKTRDAEEPLAREATGDNIVVIARKT
jgi:2-polyprenyl-3-methyl-5-hydroxy-6-metoxy-1,4-benzoquinol methylase